MVKDKKRFALLKKKKFMLFVMALLIGLTGYINYSYKKPEETAKVLGEAQYVNSNTTVEVSESQKIKMEREEARDKVKSELNEILNNAELSAETKKEAENKLLMLTDFSRIESDIEVMLKDKGFADTVVTYNENGVVVNIFKDELLSTEIAKITEVIVSQTKLPTDKIKITTNN